MRQITDSMVEAYYADRDPAFLIDDDLEAERAERVQSRVMVQT